MLISRISILDPNHKSLEIEKFMHMSFRTVENFSNSIPQSPGQRKLGKDPTPGVVRTCESWGLPGEGWSGLELTDT